jgi:hypothetical protein
MDANQMLYEFSLLYDKIASLSSPGYTAKETSVFLTKAQEVVVKRYQPAEYLERRRQDMANLTRTADIVTPSTVQDIGKPNGTRYDLPSDFLYHESEEVTVTSSDLCFDNSRIIVVPAREDEYSLQIKNPFRKPKLTGSDYDSVWRMDFYNNTNGIKRVDLITDGTFTINTYHLTYFKNPVDIVPVNGDGSTTVQSDCELNDSIHSEIVEIAVRIASGVTQPQEYQVKLNEEKLNN